MPEPDPEVPAAPDDFHHVAIEALDLATRIVKLRTDRLPEWHAHLTRHTPERFAACRRQVRSAESALSHLRHDLAGIENGPMSTRTFMRLHAARQESKDVGAQVEADVSTELEGQIVTVTGILRLAEAQVETTHLEQIQWARQEKQGWIAEDMVKLRKSLPRYRRLLDKHRLRIAAVADPKSIKLGQLSVDYGSGCEALEIYAREVLRDRRLSDFDGVDPDQLRIAVEREIGHALRAGQPRDEVSATVPQAQPTPADTSVPATKSPRTLSGWPKILPFLGLEAGDRRHRDQVKAADVRMPGPIKMVGRTPIAVASHLHAWWQDVLAGAEAVSGARANADHLKAVAELEEPGQRIEQGLHERTGPNRNQRT